MMHSGEDKSNVVQLPEGVTPFVQSTQNELLRQKYAAAKVIGYDDSGDEEYFPVVYGTGGGNKYNKILNNISERSNTESGSIDQKKKSQRVKDGDFAKMFASKDAREEVTNYEEIRNEATSKLNSVYDEIRPVIEVHGLDNQESVPTSVAEKWIEATCSKYKADFDLYFSMIENVMCPRPAINATAGPQTVNAEEGAGPQTATAEEGGE